MIKEQEIDSFPYDKASEEMEKLFSVQIKRFRKLESQIKILENDADIEKDLDSEWMFDKDDNE